MADDYLLPVSVTWVVVGTTRSCRRLAAGLRSSHSNVCYQWILNKDVNNQIVF